MSQKKRALFIDLLRGLVLLIMIEVHVFNSMLIPAIKESGWFSYLNFVNGLVASSFLFVSGLVFVLSLQKGVDELRKFGKIFWKKIGYFLIQNSRKLIYNPSHLIIRNSIFLTSFFCGPMNVQLKHFDPSKLWESIIIFLQIYISTMFFGKIQ